MCEQWWLHCTSQWQQQMRWICVLCGHNIQHERVEQHICTTFCIKLEHSSMETIQMIQKATAMDNWWLAASSQQCTCSCITSHAEFFWWNIKSPRWLNPPTAQIGTLQLLAFFKTKITFEREEISDHWWDSGKYNGAVMASGRTVCGPKVPTLKGTEVSLSYTECSLYLPQ